MDSGGEGLSEEMERHEDETGSGKDGSEMETESEEDSESGSEESEEGEGSAEEEEEEEEDGSEGGEEDDGEEDSGEEWETSSETSDSEEEDESEEGEEDDINKPGPSKSSPKEEEGAPSSGGNIPNLDDISDLSDDEVERCPICLCRFTTKSIGMPESCDHAFCLECITEWAKNVNTCPKDRQVFNLILVRHDLEGPIVRRIHVADKKPEEEVAEEEDTTCCEVCGRTDREDRLLLCDGCDLAYHCECLDPPLHRVPSDEWFCPDCTSFGVADSIQATTPTVTPRRTRANSESGGQRRRQIARTLVAERVRNAIAELRSVRGRRRIVSDSEEDSEQGDVLDAQPAVEVARPSPSAPRARSTSTRKKTTKRKTRKRRKRKTTKRKTTKRKTTKKKTKAKSTAKKSTTGKRKTTKTKRKTKKKKVPTATLR